MKLKNGQKVSNLQCALVPFRRDCKFITAALNDTVNLKINCDNIKIKKQKNVKTFRLKSM